MIARLAIALAAACACGTADAAPRADPFSALVGKRQSSRGPAAAAVERYIVATDDRVFLFQGDSRQGRLKYLCADGDQRLDCVIDEDVPAEEILLLKPSRASRGQVIWRDIDGALRLRIAAHGGVTVFWPGDARGQAAAKSFGEDPPLVLSFVSLEGARARAQRATAIISADVGAPIVFDIGDPEPDADGGASVLADAVVRAAKGMGRVARDPTGARVIAARIRRVEFQAGEDPNVRMRKDALVVGYNPDLDVAGRPTSSAIAAYLEDSL
jgi:hypothetical protein